MLVRERKEFNGVFQCERWCGVNAARKSLKSEAVRDGSSVRSEISVEPDHQEIPSPVGTAYSFLPDGSNEPAFDTMSLLTELDLNLSAVSTKMTPLTRLAAALNIFVQSSGEWRVPSVLALPK